jgi:predicted nucleic acid-binding protein
MTRTRRRIYWDSCVFIHVIQQTPELRTTLEAILDEARAGSLVIVTSALTLAEVRGAGSEADEAMVDEMFRQDYIVVRVLDPPLASRARRLGREHGIKPADAIHVATAIDLGAEVMHTMDGKTKKRGLIAKSGQLEEVGLRIREPDWPVQTKLELDEQPDQE